LFIKRPLQPVILSGGSGTRLWPLSRQSFPKQYIKLDSSSEFSSLQKTYLRLSGLKNIERPIIICNEEQRFIVAEQMREINIKPKSIILESEGRNTAPAISIAAIKSLKNNNNPNLLILSSDHEIKNEQKFIAAVEAGLPDAEDNKLVHFGIKPTKPETGYGYIEVLNNIKRNCLESSPISRFVEKPSLETAVKLINDERYFWNSGIFLFKASAILKELEKFVPKLVELCKISFLNSSVDFDFLRLEKKSFEKCPNLSIDYAVMEKTQNACLISLDSGWSDIGNWKALYDLNKKDKNGNSIIGDVVSKNVKNCYLNSEDKLLVTIGIENLICVQTNDATLVVNNKYAQEIKNIVNQLYKEGRSEAKEHQKVFRPWGYYKSIEKNSNWQVKEIMVNPSSSLSLQKHKYRSEHWIVIKGIAKVQINENKISLTENQSTYIPLNTKHRLSNEEDTPLIVIEVQCGTYLGEDDIYRYDDNYGRKN